MSKYGGFFGRYFPVISLNTAKYGPEKLRTGQVFDIVILSIFPRDQERKLTQIFIFKLLFSVSKGFRKALKAFIKPFETLQRGTKIKIEINFYFNVTF